MPVTYRLAGQAVANKCKVVLLLFALSELCVIMLSSMLQQ